MFVPILNREIHVYFPTCVMRRRLPDAETLNAALAAYCRTSRATAPGVQKSNHGGWQSEPTLFVDPDPAVAPLREAVLRALVDLSALVFGTPTQSIAIEDNLTAWININEAGDYNAHHVHLPATWSGVYYVEVGVPPADARPNSGDLELFDPRGQGLDGTGATFSHQSRILVTPEPGLLVIFPGYLEHFVHPYAGTTPRISIAFNARMRRKT